MSKEEMQAVYGEKETTVEGTKVKVKFDAEAIKAKAKKYLPYVATGAVVYFGGRYLYGKLEEVGALEEIDVEIETGD